LTGLLGEVLWVAIIQIDDEGRGLNCMQVLGIASIEFQQFLSSLSLKLLV
jgi:hypothetical protein